MVDRYLGAWSSGDPAKISALHRDDATFSDSLLGVEASAAADIELLGDKGFSTSSTAV